MKAEADDPGLVMRMAKAEAELGRAGRVEALLERATSHQPRDPNTWVQSGLVRDRVGRTDQAAADFARAIELLPRGPLLRLAAELADPRAGRPRACVLRAAGCSARRQATVDWERPLPRTPRSLALGRRRLCPRHRARSIPRGRTSTTSTLACSCWLETRRRYRRLIQKLSDQAEETKDPRLAYELARACIITPEMTADPDRVIRWARLAAESKPLAWHSHVVGAAYYRAGRLRRSAPLAGHLAR